jgi:NADH:ubiquinone oxidoreductase subunit F (NADH-binding)
LSDRKRPAVPEELRRAGGLAPDLSREISAETGAPEAHVYGVGSFFSLLARPEKKLRVCTGASCLLAGAHELLASAEAAGLPVEESQCLAACDVAPAVLKERSVLPRVTPADVEAAAGDWQKLESAGSDGDRVWRGEVGGAPGDAGGPVFDLASERDMSGEARARAAELGPEGVIAALEVSGLQGRGGAGFPAHRKWSALRAQAETRRYVVLNADESEPGTFKDRELLVRRPDLVLDGLAIAARAVAAQDVYLYLRGEFELPRRELEQCLESFREAPDLKGISFHVHSGHGGYVCGEETALLEALEGGRGMPRHRPPLPVERGLFGKPTLIQNVETIACVPFIVRQGGEAFRALGRSGPGTKLYSISGHVARPGTYELPLGVSLDELVEAAGGYLGEPFAFMPGGASSGLLPARYRDRPLDFEALGEVGSMLGSAGVVVFNRGTDLDEVVRAGLRFFEVESCGQCAPCRIGTRFLRECWDRHVAGDPEALVHVEDASWQMGEGSICGLGQTAMAPLVSALEHFGDQIGRNR